MCSNPEPAITHIVMQKEYVSFLEGQLVCVGHLRVWQYCNYPL